MPETVLKIKRAIYSIECDKNDTADEEDCDAAVT
jgi:hypothetical protein